MILRHVERERRVSRRSKRSSRTGGRGGPNAPALPVTSARRDPDLPRALPHLERELVEEAMRPRRRPARLVPSCVGEDGLLPVGAVPARRRAADRRRVVRYVGRGDKDVAAPRTRRRGGGRRLEAVEGRGSDEGRRRRARSVLRGQRGGSDRSCRREKRCATHKTRNLERLEAVRQPQEDRERILDDKARRMDDVLGQEVLRLVGTSAQGPVEHRRGGAEDERTGNSCAPASR